MTDRPARKRRRPSPVAVFATSAVLFLSALGFLSFQLAQGNDPSLGAGPLTAGTARQPDVIVRRIIKRHVVTTVVPAEAGGTVSPADSSTGSTPPAVAPDLTPAPAPAPAPPSPVVTASS